MPVLLFAGDDNYAIAQQIALLKQSLHSEWTEFNYHRFPATDLEKALLTSRTLPLGDRLRLVVVEDCKFSEYSQFGEVQLQQLQQLHLPDTTTLAFTAAHLDKRLKVVKHLLKIGKLKEFPLQSPWRTDLIAKDVANQAKAIGVRLSQSQIDYLAVAIGNDSGRLACELKKLKLYGQGKLLTDADIETLIPCQTQNSLQLAEAIRTGDINRVVLLLDRLLARAEVPVRIVATLITQFRTWLWVKSALTDKTRRKDWEIAKLCNVGNPNRLYYLRQDVAKVSISALARALSLLFELDGWLKQGGSNHFLPMLIDITHLFHSTKLQYTRSRRYDSN